MGTVSYGGAGAAAAGTTTTAVPIPAASLGDLLVMVVEFGDTVSTPPTMSSEWAFVGSFASTGTFAVDSGQRGIAIFWKAYDGLEGSSVDVTHGGATTGKQTIGQVFYFTKTSGTWALAMSGGSDNTSGTGFSVTAAGNPGSASGDYVLAAAGSAVDTAVPSSPSITWTSASVGTVTQRGDTADTTGNDGRLSVYTAPLSGAGSAAPTFAATYSVATTGPAVVVAIKTNGSLTPGRVSREHAEVLHEVDPDARISREHAEVLHEVDPDARISREHVETLLDANPDVRVAIRRHEVMIDPPVPDIRLAAQRVEVLYGILTQRVTVNRCTETDTATQLAFPQTKAVGQATETDEARPLARRYVAVLQAEETDEAPGPMVVLLAQSVLASTAIETSEAQQILAGQRKVLVWAEESDSAITIVVREGQTVEVLQATETDSAQALGIYGILLFNVSVPVELDEAQALTLFRKWPVFPASETSDPRPVYIEWVTNPDGEVLV